MHIEICNLLLPVEVMQPHLLVGSTQDLQSKRFLTDILLSTRDVRGFFFVYFFSKIHAPTSINEDLYPNNNNS